MKIKAPEHCKAAPVFEVLNYQVNKGSRNMKKRTLATSVVILSLLCNQAFAFVDCKRPISKIWSGNDDNKIYITHDDGYGNSGMTLETANNDNAIINRTLSLILVGHTAKKDVTFRYIDGSSCTSSSGTQQFVGVWLE